VVVVLEVFDTTGTDWVWHNGWTDRLEQGCADGTDSFLLSGEWRSKSPETHREGMT